MDEYRDYMEMQDTPMGLEDDNPVDEFEDDTNENDDDDDDDDDDELDEEESED